MITPLLQISKPTLLDLDRVKSLSDKHRYELGFIRRPSLQEAIIKQEMFVAVQEDDLVGFVHYHHRKRDKQTTLYHLVIHADYRRMGVGRRLVDALFEECIVKVRQLVLLKCPVDLSANQFYSQVGFRLADTEVGKSRALNIWLYFLNNL